MKKLILFATLAALPILSKAQDAESSIPDGPANTEFPGYAESGQTGYEKLIARDAWLGVNYARYAGFGTTAERDAITPVSPCLWVNTETGSLDYYDGSAWSSTYLTPTQIVALLDSHLSGTEWRTQDGTGTDDQTASEVGLSDSGGYFVGADVETALQEIGLQQSANTSKLGAIEAGATADQTASEVPFTPYGTIASTDVQTAIQEVLDEATSGALPNGGTTGQVLAKASATDQDVEWTDAASGGTNETGLTAGTVQTQAGATVTSANYSRFTTVANVDDGGRTHFSATDGIAQTIVNAGANEMLFYPINGGSDQFADSSANAPITISSGSSVTIKGIEGTSRWDVYTDDIEDDSLIVAKFADGDWGDVSVSANAVTLDAGVVAMANINATGTADSSTFLRGDGSWQTVSAGSLDRPTITAAEVDADLLTLTGSEALDFSDVSTGFDVDGATAGNDLAATYSSGRGTNTVQFMLSSAADNGDTLNLDFSGPFFSWQNQAGITVDAFSDLAVTNSTAASSGFSYNFQVFRTSGDTVTGTGNTFNFGLGAENTGRQGVFALHWRSGTGVPTFSNVTGNGVTLTLIGSASSSDGTAKFGVHLYKATIETGVSSLIFSYDTSTSLVWTGLGVWVVNGANATVVDSGTAIDGTSLSATLATVSGGAVFGAISSAGDSDTYTVGWPNSGGDDYQADPRSSSGNTISGSSADTPSTSFTITANNLVGNDYTAGIFVSFEPL